MEIELIDTHTHLYSEKFNSDRPVAIERAIKEGVSHFYLPNVDALSIEDMLELEITYPERCHAMMGLHPCSVDENVESALGIVEDWLGRRKFCAVGEIGIDLYWDKTFFEKQQQAFERQMSWAKELNIPIVIHTREAMDIAIDMVQRMKDDNLGGIFHCFGGTLEQAKKIIDLGFYLGIGGVVTYKNSGLDKVLPEIGLEKIVLETDAPYLAPVPHRGKRNESAYLTGIAHKLAEMVEVPFQEVARITTDNARKVFEEK